MNAHRSAPRSRSHDGSRRLRSNPRRLVRGRRATIRPVAGLERVLDVVRRRRPLPALLADLGSHWVGEAPDAGSSSGVRGRLGPGTALVHRAHPGVGRSRPSWVRRSWSEPACSSTRRGRRWSLATSRTALMATSTWPTPTAGTRSGSQTGLPRTTGLAARISGAKGRCGRPTDGTSRIDQWLSAGRHCRQSPDPAKAVAVIPGRLAGSSRGRPIRLALPRGSTFNTIGIYGLDGVRQALLSVPPGCAAPGDFDPVWSPDGQSLVVAVCEVPIDGRPAGRVALGDPRSHLTVVVLARQNSRGLRHRRVARMLPRPMVPRIECWSPVGCPLEVWPSSGRRRVIGSPSTPGRPPQRRTRSAWSTC